VWAISYHGEVDQGKPNQQHQGLFVDGIMEGNVIHEDQM
jgi:hypothetical protein